MKQRFFILFIALLCLNSRLFSYPIASSDNEDFVTYFGGNSIDLAWEVKLDSQENIIVVGTTQSQDFPLKNEIQDELKGLEDIFIAKFSSSGDLIFSTFYGGNNSENCFSFEIDSHDNIWISGTTSSTDFPTLNELQSEKIGEKDFFITGISKDGQSILFSTFFGGNGTDDSAKIICDSEDSIIFGCVTSSPDLPIISPLQRNFSGGENDLYLAKFSSEDFSISFSTYLGGLNKEIGYPVDVDSADNILITGYTNSNNFPLKNPLFSEIKGETDIFISKIAGNGTELIFSTIIGGSKEEYGVTGVFDSEDNIIIEGVTLSYDFPVENPFQQNHRGIGEDIFILKLDKDICNFIFSTYLGGSLKEYNGAIEIDCLSNIYITGRSASFDYPLYNEEKEEIGGETDATITIFDSEGKKILFSTFFGGSSDEWFVDLAINKEDKLTILGLTLSSDLETINAYQSEIKGDSDLVLCKLYGKQLSKFLKQKTLRITLACFCTLAIAIVSTLTIIKLKRIRV